MALYDTVRYLSPSLQAAIDRQEEEEIAHREAERKQRAALKAMVNPPDEVRRQQIRQNIAYNETLPTQEQYRQQTQMAMSDRTAGFSDIQYGIPTQRMGGAFDATGNTVLPSQRIQTVTPPTPLMGARQRAEQEIGGNFIDRATNAGINYGAGVIGQAARLPFPKLELSPGVGRGFHADPQQQTVGEAVTRVTTPKVRPEQVPGHDIPIVGRPFSNLVSGSTSGVGAAATLAFPLRATRAGFMGAMALGSLGEAADEAGVPNPTPIRYGDLGLGVGGLYGGGRLPGVGVMERAGQRAATRTLEGAEGYVRTTAKNLPTSLRASTQEALDTFGRGRIVPEMEVGARVHEPPSYDDLFGREGTYKRAAVPGEDVVIMSGRLPPSSVINEELAKAERVYAAARVASPRADATLRARLRVAQLKAMKEIDDIAASGQPVFDLRDRIADEFDSLYAQVTTREQAAMEAADAKGVSSRFPEDNWTPEEGRRNIEMVSASDSAEHQAAVARYEAKSVGGGGTKYDRTGKPIRQKTWRDTGEADYAREAGGDPRFKKGADAVDAAETFELEARARVYKDILDDIRYDHIDDVPLARTPDTTVTQAGFGGEGKPLFKGENERAATQGDLGIGAGERPIETAGPMFAKPPADALPPPADVAPVAPTRPAPPVSTTPVAAKTVATSVPPPAPPRPWAGATSGATPPPKPPAPAAAAATTPPAKPKAWRAREIIDRKEKTMLKPGRITQAPGVKQVLRFANPMVDMPRNVFVRYVARAGARAAVRSELGATRTPIVRELAQAWKEEAPKYIGGSANKTLDGTLVDFIENPDLYAAPSARLEAARDAYNQSGATLPGKLNEEFGTEIGTVALRDSGGGYVPHVEAKDSVDDAVNKIVGTRTTAGVGKAAPGKTRYHETLRDRVASDATFKPELDLERLTHQHDAAFAKMAGDATFKEGLGKSRSAVIEEARPGAAEARQAITRKVTNIQARLITAKRQLSELGVSQKAIERQLKRPSARVTPIEEEVADLAEKYGPELSHLSGQAYELRGQIRALRAATGKLAARRGVKAVGLAQLEQDADALLPQLARMRKGYATAQTGDYVQNQTTHLFHTAEESKAIDDVLRTKLNMGQRYIDFVNEVRSTAFAGDFSPIVGIQAPLGFLSDPFAGAKALRGMGRELASPGKAFAKEFAEHPDDMTAFAEHSGYEVGQLGQEFMEPGKGIARIKKADAANQRMMGAVRWLQYNLWKGDVAMVTKWGRKGLDEARAESWNNVSKMIPSMNPAERGASSLQAQIERVPVVSSSFIGGPATLLKDAASGAAKLALSRQLAPGARWAELAGREQLALVRGATLAGSLVGAGVASYVAAGYSPERAVKTVTNPDGGRFLSMAIPGTDRYIPIGGPFRSFAKAFIPRNVGEAGGIPVFLPMTGLKRFALGKANPVVKIPRDLIANKDFLGAPIRKADDPWPMQVLESVWYAANQALPLSAGTASEGVRTGKGVADTAINAGAQFLGTSVYETTDWQKAAAVKDDAAQRMYEKDYADLNDAEKKAVRADPKVIAASEGAVEGTIDAGGEFGQELADDAARDQLLADFRATGKDAKGKQAMPQGIDGIDTAFLAGTTELKDWLDADHTYRDILRGAKGFAVPDDYEGEEPTDAVGIATDAFYAIEPKTYYDALTNIVDWDAYFAAKDEARAAAIDAGRQHNGEVGANDVAAYLTKTEDRHVKVLQDAARKLYDDPKRPPKYEGLSYKDEQMVDEFAKKVVEYREPIKRELGYTIRQKNIAQVLAGEAGEPEVLMEWYTALQSPTRRAALVTDDYDGYLTANREALERFYPWLYDNRYLEEMGEYESESPYAGEQREPREQGEVREVSEQDQYRDAEEQDDIRRVLPSLR